MSDCIFQKCWGLKSGCRLSLLLETAWGRQFPNFLSPSSRSAEMNDMYVWKGPGIWRQEAAYFLNQELLRNASRISFRCPAKLNASWNHPIGELAGAAGLCAHMTWFRMFGPAHDH